MKKDFSEVIDKPNVLGIYFSAGYPYLEATGDLALMLQDYGADFIEIGMPYSDPLADGPVIEACHQKALKNGMSINLMFEQISKVRDRLHIPIVLMGYFNPVFKFGIERFCDECASAGVDSVILPDMPVELYAEHYYSIFNKRGISCIFLATPATPPERLELIDKYSEPFIYLVSSSSTTGQTKGMTSSQLKSFSEVKTKVSKPVMIGFGISTNEDFTAVNKAADGAIIGSAFLRAIEGTENEGNLKSAAATFIQNIRGRK